MKPFTGSICIVFMAILPALLPCQSADLAVERSQSTTGPVPPPDVAVVLPETGPPSRTQVVIAGVPGYIWRHGCGPTAVGMVVGYYDTHGYPDLIPGFADTQTNSVNQAIASQDSSANPQNYEDYSEPIDTGEPSVLPDKSEDPPGDEHADNCIADYMETSFSSAGNFYGWSWSNDIGPAFTGYVNLVAPEYLPTTTYFHSGNPITWSVLTTEINHNRPMVFLVDTNGDGYTDHFVTVVGYRDDAGQEYGCLDTWSPASEIRWCTFAPIQAGQPWGIWGGNSFQLNGGSALPSISPTGAVITVLLISILIVIGRKR